MFDPQELANVNLLSPSFLTEQSDIELPGESIPAEEVSSSFSLIIEVELKFDNNGHHFRIYKVVLSSKHRSRKFVILVEIPSFL